MIPTFSLNTPKLWYWRGFVTRVIDGDTVDIFLDRGFKHYAKDRYRIYGINTPEIRDSDILNREKAQLAKKRVQELLEGKEFLIRSMGQDKYGRWLCEIYLEIDKEFNPIKPISQLLIDEGLAVPY